MPAEGWDAFYKANAEPPIDFMVRITRLWELKRPKDIEAAIKSFLRYHGKNANANMYQLLAVAMELNGQPKDEVKTALAWAGFLARRGTEPVIMTSVADLMIVHGFTDLTVNHQGKPYRSSVGDLLDRAAEIAPHWDEPLLMSINLAERSNDPDRMIASVEKLLALGWPGRDEVYRANARKLVEVQAKRLQSDDKSDSARVLLDRLAGAEQRDLVVRLTWTGNAALDLAVNEPLGARADHFTPRTVFGGALVKEGRGSHPGSTYTCPLGFDGDYVVKVKPLYNDPDDPARQATLEIVTHEGTPEERIETRTILIDKPEPTTVRLEHGRRKVVLPFKAPPVLRIVRDKKSSKTTNSEQNRTKHEHPKQNIK
ncbi:MAG: hypothetical protein ABI353_18880 [Isosphaeraceae bacterium]